MDTKKWPEDPTDGKSHQYIGKDGRMFYYNPDMHYPWFCVSDAVRMNRTDISEAHADSLPIKETRIRHLAISREPFGVSNSADPEYDNMMLRRREREYRR